MRESKYSALAELEVSNTDWEEIRPHPPYFQFVPLKSTVESEFMEGWRVTEVLPTGSNGVQTSRDQLVVAYNRDQLIERCKALRNKTVTDEDIRLEFNVEDHSFWQLAKARAALMEDTDWSDHVQPYLYRPFDLAWLLASADFVHRLREAVMRHLRKPNLAFCVGRAGLVAAGTWDLLFCTNQMCDHNLFYRGSSLNFPLYLYPAGKEKESGAELGVQITHWPAGHGGRRPNLNPDFTVDLEKRIGLSFVTDGKGDLKKTFGPEDVFNYIYAICHSPTYRTRYAEFLKSDFPRVPLTSDRNLFRSLCNLGTELVALHLLESPKLKKPIARFPTKGSNLVEKGFPKYFGPGELVPGRSKPLEAGRVYISKDDPQSGKTGQYFEGVPPEAWEFHIGGYQVCEKWLKDRRGRTLTYEDLEHYCKVVTALQETTRLMAAIDAAIPDWPMQ